MDAYLADAAQGALDLLRRFAPFGPQALMATGGLFILMGLYCAALPKAAARGLGMTLTDAKGGIEFRAQYGGGLIGPGAAFAAAGHAGAPYLVPGLAFAIAYLGGLGALRALGLAASGERSGLMNLFLWTEAAWVLLLGLLLAGALLGP